MRRILFALFALAIGVQAAMAAGAVPHVDRATFEYDVLRSSSPVLVQFDATWCGYCRALQPALEQAQAENRTNMKFYKLDVDGNPSIMRYYGVRSLPTLIVFKDGQEVARRGGIAPADLGGWVRQVQDLFATPQ